MKKILPILLTATLVVACQEQQPTAVPDDVPILFAISDGASGGNRDFFFYPPLASSPTGHTNFDAGEFNPYLTPSLRICDYGTTQPPDPVPNDPNPPECINPGPSIPMELDADNDLYRYQWKTTDLQDGHYYRIQVFVGTPEAGYLGIRDVRALDGPATANCPTSEPFCQVNINSTVPIKVRIENYAFCPLTRNCQTKSFDLADGAQFEVQADTFPVLLDVPAQTSQTGTVTFQQCREDDTADFIDIPLFGPCIETVLLSSSQPIALDPDATATISFCEIDITAFGLSVQQQENLRVHHFLGANGDEGAEALRIANECDRLSTNLASNPIERFASRFLSWITPRPLQAAAVAGKGGFGGNSLDKMGTKFKIGLPAKINFVDVADTTRVAPTGSTLSTGAVVTDLNDDAVAGATVRWNVATEGGTVANCSIAGNASVDDDLVCKTNSDGEVWVDWTLATEPGVNKLTAGGRGIADPREDFNGPRGKERDAEGFLVDYDTGPFDPFQPIAKGESDADTIDLETEETFTTIRPGTQILFTAIGCESGFGTPNFPLNGQLTDGEWDCAIQKEFPVNLSGGSTVYATLYYMNDDTDFHLAVAVPGTGRVNGLRVEWDSNGNGNAFGRQVGDDVWEFEPDDGAADKFIDDKCSTSSQSSCGSDDVSSTGGVMDTEAAFDNTGGTTVYEMSHPLLTSQTCGPVGGKKGCSSAFPIDLQAEKGQMKGAVITLRLGSGAQGNTQYPGFLDYLMIEIK